MATRPTRQQEQACDQLAEALGLIGEGARLDGKGGFDAADLAEVARRLAKASSLSLDTIIGRTIERRGRALKLRAGTAELLTLLDGEITSLDTLLLDDDAFRALVGRLEEELGDV
jgi:hypothetical protein